MAIDTEPTAPNMSSVSAACLSDISLDDCESACACQRVYVDQPLLRGGRWLAKGGFAVLDQGLFAGSNFIANVFLARWLTSDEYGAFALAYSVYLLFSIFHGALLTGPMLVFGAGEYRERFSEYLGVLLRGHIFLTALGGFILASVAFVMFWVHSQLIGSAFSALALATPTMLLTWLMRRAFYAQVRPHWAAAGGAIYLFTLIGTLFALRTCAQLTPTGAILTMGLAGLTTNSFYLYLLRPIWIQSCVDMRTVTADHWRYGRWIAAAACPNWIIDNIYFIVLPAWVGLAAAGGLKALLNLAMPLLQTTSALSVLLIPALVHRRNRFNPIEFSRTVILALTAISLGSACYLVAIWSFRIPIFSMVYPGKYVHLTSWPLSVVCLLPFFHGASDVLGAGLSSLEAPQHLFWSAIGGTIIALGIGLLLASRLAVGGALIGIVASYAIMSILMTLSLKRLLKGEHWGDIR